MNTSKQDNLAIVPFEPIQVVAVPHPFKAARAALTVKEGTTIAEILEIVQPNAFWRRDAHVYINDVYVYRERWELVRPRPGDLVTVRMVPHGGGGGGGKTVLRIVLMVLVVVVAAVATWYLGGAGGYLAGTLGWSVEAANIVAGAVGSVITVAGNLAINALIPPPQPRMPSLTGTAGGTGASKDSPTMFIEGARNRLMPYGVIPRLLGKHRMTPYYAAPPYTEVAGDDQYIRLAFCWGYGPLHIPEDSLKIGETLLSEFSGVDIEHRYGYDDDEDLTLYTNQVHEAQPQITLRQADGFHVRTTQPDCDEISVDWTFVQGLCRFDKDDGQKESETVEVEIQYAPTGTSDWTAGTDEIPLAEREVTLEVPDQQTEYVITCAYLDESEGYKQCTYPSSSYTQCSLPKEGGTCPYSQGSATYTAYNMEQCARVCIDKASGDLSAIYGTAKREGSGASAPAVPSDKISLCQTTLVSGQTEIADADITDERTADEPSRKTASDFAPSEDSPKSLDIVIAAGDLYYDYPSVFSTTAARTSALRRSVRFVPGARGQYDVRMRRVTSDYNLTRVVDTVVWSIMRSISIESPINKTGMALTALRIKATDQLNGIVDTFNGEPESILLDYNGSTWVEQPTSNPASLYREVLQGAANHRPLADSRIDLTNLEEWHERNAAAGREFNMVMDYSNSVKQALADIAAAGRAARSLIDGKWGVVMDKPQTTYRQHFTPKNSWGYRGERIFRDLPHGWRCRFANRNEGWRQDERIVYDDGYDSTNATLFESLDLVGITDENQIWSEGRYHIAVARLRPENHIFYADFEQLVCTRGDLILFAHDVPLIGLSSGRVKAVQDDGGSPAYATGVTLDEVCPMSAGKSYTIRFRLSDNTTLLQTVQTDPGDQTTIAFDTPVLLTSAPEIGDLFMFGEVGSEAMELVVKTILPGPDLSAKLICVSAAPAVHNADLEAIPEFDSQITVPDDLGSPVVEEIRSDETVMVWDANGTLRARILITLALLSYRDLDKVTGVEVQARLQGDNTWPIIQVEPRDAVSISLYDLEEGMVYELRLRYQQAENSHGPWTSTYEHTMIGRTSLPDDIGWLTIENNILRWEYPTKPIDFAGFQVRHRAGNNRLWADATVAHDDLTKDTTFPLDALPSGTRTIMVKAVDLAGNESENPAVLVKDLGDPIVDNVIVTDDHHADGFVDGTITNGTVDGVSGDLEADGAGTTFWPDDDNAVFWDANASALFWDSDYLEMTYLFDYTPVESDTPAQLTLSYTIAGDPWQVLYRPAGDGLFWETPDSRTFWGDDTDLFWPEAADFIPWPGALDVTRRKYEFKIITGAGTVQGVISALQLKLDLPDITEFLSDVVLASGGTRLSITETYREIVNVQITLQDDGGDAIGVRIIDKDESLGPLVQGLDKTETGTAALIDATIQGY